MLRDKEIISEARKRNRDKWVEKRLYALELRASGKSAAEVAALTGFHEASIPRLTVKYQKGSIEAICGNHYGRNRKNMTYEEAVIIRRLHRFFRGLGVGISQIFCKVETVM